MTRNYISRVGADSFAVQEAATSGIKSIENFIGLMSRDSFNSDQPSSSSASAATAADLESARNTTADVTVSKFKRVISLLDRTRTGHARFRRAPTPVINSPVIQEETKTTPFYSPPPQQQIRKGSFSSSFKTIDFSSLSSVTTESDHKMIIHNHRPSETAPFMSSQTQSLSTTVSSFSKSTKRKCNSENLITGKCASGSSGRCHCSKKR